MVKLTVRRVGNSLGLILPAEAAKALRVGRDEEEGLRAVVADGDADGDQFVSGQVRTMDPYNPCSQSRSVSTESTGDKRSNQLRTDNHSEPCADNGPPQVLPKLIGSA